jgi:hypothetical protein
MKRGLATLGRAAIMLLIPEFISELAAVVHFG